ncbi:MAG: D-arabinose 5-phosphate isomerase [Candidatus Cloacimonadota bacterium]|nr:MAG: D-arabinose 5-phosphate isomerase [Candidatus Cloacimonadota bacterium]PIE78761.1 MAG: D-arabinose 5-phosphate isomerase [Candidatus Delongbacteria bacterium]
MIDYDKILNMGREVLKIEADALNRTKDLLDKNFSKAIDIISSRTGKVVVSGMGKSGLIGSKIAATMSSTGTLAVFLHPAEGLHGDLGIVEKGDVVILIGKSGESDELTGMLPVLKTIGCKIVAITGNLESTLARNSDVILNGSVIKEACGMNLAPTASTTVALAIGDALSTVLSEVRNFKEENYALFHPAGTLGKRLHYKVRDFVHPLSEVATVDDNSTFKDVLVAMSQNNLGACLSVKGNQLSGIITDGDIKRIIAMNKDFEDIKVYEVMTKTPKIVSSTTTAYEALQIMKKSDSFSVLPVVENGNILGLIRLHDLLKSGL